LRHHGQFVNAIQELLDAEFGCDSRAPMLIELATNAVEYDEEVARALLSAARGESGERWPERRLAVLLLENHLLRLPSGETGILREIRADEPGVFCRMARLRRAHDAIAVAPDDPVAWRYFFRVARDINKLHLARFVFSPDEVAFEIRRHLGISRGVEALRAKPLTLRPVEAPEYESAILDRLCASNEIYWVSERCGSELNALVEFPLTSAVVVVKPPGSEFEIEFKRAGVRRERRLDVISRSGAKEAPVSHRLFGGSIGWLGEREATASDLFDRIYRLVHGAEGPCSRTVQIRTIVTAPDGGAHILDYLTDSPAETREAMQICVREFPRDTGVRPASYEGERGLTLQFIGQALPQQAVLFGSSSFRLDRIALYLGEDGPEHYFPSSYTIADARWLADSVLEEILGEVDVPAEPYSDYAQYIRAAFAIPANRMRADDAYLSVMAQFGECWGTLLALRGFSDGESFVQRNVGLKCRWRDGAWQPRVIFMDHDDLTMAGSRYPYPWPQRELAGAERDQVHILGGAFAADDIVPGAGATLRGIYRIWPGGAENGRLTLERALVDAYRKTQDHLDRNPELRTLFYREFLDNHRDFDRLVRNFLATDPAGEEGWRRETESYLESRGYGRELMDELLESIPRRRGFLERMSFLYR
jgi:hypothetical protein